MPEQNKKTLHQTQKVNHPELISSIEDCLAGDIKQTVLDIVEYCKANKMPIRWGTTYQWYVYFKSKHIASIMLRFKGMINGNIGKKIVVKDNSCSIFIYLDLDNPVYGNFIINENLSEIIWENVKHCEGCISCAPGREKTILGKSFNNVCIGGSVLFKNPNVESMHCIKKLLEFKKYLITAGKV